MLLLLAKTTLAAPIRKLPAQRFKRLWPCRWPAAADYELK
jgi:hypothetical protein